MQLAENGRVLLMLVDRNYLPEVLLLQSRYHILTHEPGSARDNNLSRCHESSIESVQIPVYMKTTVIHSTFIVRSKVGRLRVAETAEQNTTSLGPGAPEEFHLSRGDRLSTVAGFVTLVLTIILFALVPAPEGPLNRASFYKQAFIRLHVIMAGVFVSSWL